MSRTAWVGAASLALLAGCAGREVRLTDERFDVSAPMMARLDKFFQEYVNKGIHTAIMAGQRPPGAPAVKPRTDTEI